MMSPHSLSVTTVTLGSRLFLILLQINLDLFSGFYITCEGWVVAEWASWKGGTDNVLELMNMSV